MSNANATHGMHILRLRCLGRIVVDGWPPILIFGAGVGNVRRDTVRMLRRERKAGRRVRSATVRVLAIRKLWWHWPPKSRRAGK